jgi:putative transposon-encoded protein
MTPQTKQFKDFGLEPESKPFSGDKIDLIKILNTPVTVHACKIVPSTKTTGLCLHLQIEHKTEKRVVFTGASALIDVAKRFPENAFPFTTTIVKKDQRYEFT